MAARFATGPRMRCAGTRGHAQPCSAHAVELLYCVALGTFDFARRRIVVDTSLMPAARPRPTSPPSNATTATSRPWLRDRKAGCGGFVTDRRTGSAALSPVRLRWAARQGAWVPRARRSRACARSRTVPARLSRHWLASVRWRWRRATRRTLARRRSLARSTVTG
jgi:hypothetical protein